MEGEPTPVTEQLLVLNEKNEQINIEFWGVYLVEDNTFFFFFNPSFVEQHV